MIANKLPCPPHALANCEVPRLVTEYLRLVHQQTPAKYKELTAILQKISAHVEARKKQGWYSGRIYAGSAMTNAVVNNQNASQGATETNSTPEQNNAAFNECAAKMEKLQKGVAQARKTQDRLVHSQPLNAMDRGKIKAYLAKNPGAPKLSYPQGIPQEASPATIAEAEVLLLMLKDELDHLAVLKKRSWGLCRDWANSINLALSHLKLAHYTVKLYQVEKRDWLIKAAEVFAGEGEFGVDQHSVVVLCERKASSYKPNSQFEMLVDAWVYPVLYHQLPKWLELYGWTLPSNYQAGRYN